MPNSNFYARGIEIADNFIDRCMPIDGNRRSFVQTAAEIVALVTTGFAADRADLPGLMNLSFFASFVSTLAFAHNATERKYKNILAEKHKFEITLRKLPKYLFSYLAGTAIYGYALLFALNALTDKPQPIEPPRNFPAIQQSLNPDNGPK
jgi:hypothetical protein